MSFKNKEPNSPKEFLFEVKEFKMITPTVFELSFVSEEEFKFKAGQFISVVVPNVGPKGAGIRRAYSIASSPQESVIKFCVKLIENGPGTNYLYKLRPGDRFRGFAPYGHFTYKEKQTKNVYFIATGTGIAPFLSMISSREFEENKPDSLTVLFGVRDENELIYSNEFNSIPGVNFVPTVSRPNSSDWNGFKGRVTDYIRSHADKIPWTESVFFLCGNSSMIDEIKSFALSMGVNPVSIHQEIYYRVKD